MPLLSSTVKVVSPAERWTVFSLALSDEFVKEIVYVIEEGVEGAALFAILELFEFVVLPAISSAGSAPFNTMLPETVYFEFLENSFSSPAEESFDALREKRLSHEKHKTIMLSITKPKKCLRAFLFLFVFIFLPLVLL